MFDNFFGQFNFSLGRRTKGKPFEQGFANRLDHGGMPVSQNHGAP